MSKLCRRASGAGSAGGKEGGGDEVGLEPDPGGLSSWDEFFKFMPLSLLPPSALRGKR